MSTPDPPLVWIYLSNGTATSGGSGPGPVQVPPGEAAFFVRERLAVHGTVPPTGLLGNGVTIAPSTGRGYGAG
jgi:hypothetical protein